MNRKEFLTLLSLATTGVFTVGVIPSCKETPLSAPTKKVVDDKKLTFYLYGESKSPLLIHNNTIDLYPEVDRIDISAINDHHKTYFNKIKSFIKIVDSEIFDIDLLQTAFIKDLKTKIVVKEDDNVILRVDSYITEVVVNSKSATVTLLISGEIEYL